VLGTSGFTLLGAGARLCKRSSALTAGEEPLSNGNCPVNISKSTTPNAYTSLAGVCGLPSSCSGAMYPKVPTSVGLLLLGC
jgi:hypothetical protein